MKIVIVVISVCISCFTFGYAEKKDFPEKYSMEVKELINCMDKTAKTTLDMNNYMHQIYQIVDGEVDRVYKKIIKSLSSYNNEYEKKFNKKISDAIKKSQEAWIKYRESNAHWIYTQWGDGSIRNLQYSTKKINMTFNRIDELKREYSIVFYDEINPDDFLGKWKKVIDEDVIIEFQKNKDGKYIFKSWEKGNLSSIDYYQIEDRFLIIKNEKGKTILNKWFYISEKCKISSWFQNECFLDFLGEGGNTEERFINISK